MSKKRDSAGLRNTIYDQQTRSGRRLSAGRLLLYRSAVPLAALLVRALWRWSKVRHVIGAEHIPAAMAKAPSFIPAYWHQHQLVLSKYLYYSPGVKLGLLISPSVDGEFGAIGALRIQIQACPHGPHHRMVEVTPSVVRVLTLKPLRYQQFDRFAKYFRAGTTK